MYIDNGFQELRYNVCSLTWIFFSLYDKRSTIFYLAAPIPQFFSTDPVSYEKDAYVAHKTSAIAHLTVRYVTLAIQEQELMQLAEISLR